MEKPFIFTGKRGSLMVLQLMANYGIWLESLELKREMARRPVKDIQPEDFDDDNVLDEDSYISISLRNTSWNSNF